MDMNQCTNKIYSQHVSYIPQEGEDPEQAVVPQPCLSVVGRSTDTIVEAKLIIERKVVMTLPAKQAPLVLLAAFYAFNMHYTEGCLNFFKALDIIFLGGKKDKKRPKLNRFLADIEL